MSYLSPRYGWATVGGSLNRCGCGNKYAALDKVVVASGINNMKRLGWRLGWRCCGEHMRVWCASK